MIYDRLAGLALDIEGYELEPLSLEVSSGFTRETTEICLRGAGAIGRGEEVTYSAEEQQRFRVAGSTLSLAGRWTIDTFSSHLDSLSLWPEAPEQHAWRDYRRWAFESAALDLALRQAGHSLAQVLGRSARPLTFVCSTRLDGDPLNSSRLRAYRKASPGLRFKLDPTAQWTRALVDELASMEAVDVADLKGAYVGTLVDNTADPTLYRLVLDGFPESVWIEDPGVTDETRPVLEPHAARITWDATIHSVADIEACPWPPRSINIKPSRFGTLERLCAAYEYCEANGIAMYGGGQFELGVGRAQVQRLASIFHPNTGNDVAPAAFHAPEPPAELPRSPLTPPAEAPGFRWA